MKNLLFAQIAFIILFFSCSDFTDPTIIREEQVVENNNNYTNYESTNTVYVYSTNTVTNTVSNVTTTVVTNAYTPALLASCNSAEINVSSNIITFFGTNQATVPAHVEDYDTYNQYTNCKYTPHRAGAVLLAGVITVYGREYLVIYKNGVAWRTIYSQTPYTTLINYQINFSTIDYASTSDEYEFRLHNPSANSISIIADKDKTWISAANLN